MGWAEQVVQLTKDLASAKKQNQAYEAQLRTQTTAGAAGGATAAPTKDSSSSASITAAVSVGTTVASGGEGGVWVPATGDHVEYRGSDGVVQNVVIAQVLSPSTHARTPLDGVPVGISFMLTAIDHISNQMYVV